MKLSWLWSAALMVGLAIHGAARADEPLKTNGGTPKASLLFIDPDRNPPSILQDQATRGADARNRDATLHQRPAHPDSNPDSLTPSAYLPSRDRSYVMVEQPEYKAAEPTPSSNQNPGFNIDFKNGVGMSSGDRQFTMNINALWQIDYRMFTHTADRLHTGNSLHDNFVMPRIRLFFRGNVTEFVDYAVSLNTGLSPNALGNVPAPTNLLDAYLDFNFFGTENKEYFQVRVGRMKTPYGYQFYKISPQDFVTPELSMFSTNFLQNWETGAMAHGLLFDKTFEYAAGVFNGVPNSFEVPQNDRQGIFFGAVTPFRHHEETLLQHLVVSGSYAVGHQFGPPFPNALGTATSSNGPPDNLIVSPTFLLFNGAAIQSGVHDLWAFDVVWHYRSLNFYGEYNGGRQTYALAATPDAKVPVTLSGYSAAVSCFFTGEEISTNRARLKPLRPYNWCSRDFGAIEGFARFSNLSMGTNILHSGLLAAGANANQVDAVDVGLHWYPNEYVRISFDWQHAAFNQPISTAPGTIGAPMTSVQDLFWFRTQLYY